VNSNGWKPIDLEFQHELGSDEQRIRKMELIIRHKYGENRKEITLVLDSY